ncbi:MAG: discoidin domain-containing protein [Luteolibacter sp.]
MLPVLFFANAFAATLPAISLIWNSNPESNIARYEVRYGTASGKYTNSINAGSQTSTPVSGLQEGVTYYFAVYAYNTNGLVSVPSSEVSYRSDARVSMPPNGTITTPNVNLVITAGETITFVGNATDPNNLTPLTYHWNFGSGSGVAEGARFKTVSRQFNVPGTYTVSFTVTNSAGLSDPTPATRTVTVLQPRSSVVPRKKWKLKYVDSQEIVGYAASGAFDGKPSTFWSTAWTGASIAPPPHEIQIKLASSTMVNGFRYLPRQDSFSVGNIAKYEFYVSEDGVKWGKPVATGVFANSSNMKRVFFSPKRGKFIRLRQLTEANGYSDCCMAELYVLQPSKKSSANSNPLTANSASNVPTADNVSIQTSLLPAATAIPKPTTSITVIDGEKHLVLTVPKPIISDGAIRTVEVSSDLLNWYSGGKYTTVLVDDDDFLVVRDNAPVTKRKKRYIRLKPRPH